MAKTTAADWLNEFDWDEYDECRGSTASWFSVQVKKKMNYDANPVINATRFLSPKTTKETMSRWLFDAWKIIDQQSDTLETFKEIIELMKTEALVDKGKVISAQEKLLECQKEQLDSLKSAVESTVQTSVQQEIKLYSEAVTKSSKSVVTQESLKKVVKCAIEEDDRSKNLIIFGLAEDDGEQLDNKVHEVFSELAEKPKVASCRIGAKKSGNTTCRPVKVTLATSTTAHQILVKAKNLKQSQNFKSVYICPDRSPEDRAARRTLVLELKAAAEKQPKRKFYIKDGKVVSVES